MERPDWPPEEAFAETESGSEVVTAVVEAPPTVAILEDGLPLGTAGACATFPFCQSAIATTPTTTTTAIIIINKFFLFMRL
jgi:hypothetical protein